MDIDQIKRISIVDYAEEIGFHPYKIGHYYSLKEHDSVRIDPDKNIFVQNSTGAGGSVIDFAMTFQGMDLKRAIRTLGGKTATGSVQERKDPDPETRKEKIGDLKLPEKDSNMKNIFAYLIKTRGIDQTIVQEMVQRKALYQDIHKNCVFVSRDDSGKPVFACIRGTNTYKKFVADAFGCDYSYGLFLPNGGDRLIVTESAIDAMSVMNLLEIGGTDHKAYDYLALSGCGKTEVIETHLHNHDYRIVDLCLDSDEAGRRAAKALSVRIKEISKAAVYTELPGNEKDYNDVLKQVKAAEITKAKELQPEL